MPNELEFMSRLNAAVREHGRTESRLLLYAIFISVTWFFVWAYNAQLDEVTRGMGQIIPSSKTQVIQNLEGGIVLEILVRQGDLVQKDQPLLKIDNKKSESSLEENVLRFQDLKIRKQRLIAEVSGAGFVIDPELEKSRPEIVQNERALLTTNQSLLQNQVQITASQVDQRRAEIAETRSRVKNIEENMRLLEKQMVVTKPLVEKKIESQTEYLKLEREMSGLQERLESSKLSLPRLEGAIRELERKNEEMRNSFRSRAQKELNDILAELSQIGGKQVAFEDQVVRTTVRSPIKGIVKTLHVNTIGGVVKPMMDLIEIVPFEDNLLVEAQIRPADIAFIHPDQQAMIKVTAYDFSIYGGFPGKVTQISADTLTDPRGQTYYLVRLKTDRNYLGKKEKQLKIIPGMTVSVDIITGKKSVLDYLLKPILRAKEEALTER